MAMQACVAATVDSAESADGSGWGGRGAWVAAFGTNALVAEGNAKQPCLAGGFVVARGAKGSRGGGLTDPSNAALFCAALGFVLTGAERCILGEAKVLFP